MPMPLPPTLDLKRRSTQKSSDTAPVSVGRRRYFRLTDLYILDKEKKIIPFVPNSIQMDALKKLGLKPDTDARDMKGLRDMYLKARQEGISTLIEALIFLNTINTDNTKSVLTAADEAQSVMLFQMIHRYYENLPEDSRPDTQYSSKKELVWPGIGSSIHVDTAGRKVAFRGTTPSNVHCSEIAHWPSTATEIMTSLSGAAPVGANIFLETTANGMHGEFYEEWQLATGKIEQTPSGRTASRYRPHFYPWFQFDKYTTPAAPDFEITEEEQVWKDVYGITNDQIQWYRDKRNEPGMGRVRMAQEFPFNDIEAFRASGDAFFDRFDDDTHHKVGVFNPSDNPPPRHYKFRVGVDWGFGSPYAYVLGCKDEFGTQHVLESYEEAGLTDTEQAAIIKEALVRWKIPIKSCDVVCDGSMWNQDTHNGVRMAANIDEYYKAGLRCIRAPQGAKPNRDRNSSIRATLAKPLGIIIYKGYNHRLIECLKGATHSIHDIEQVTHDEYSHLIVGLGNLCCPLQRDAVTPEEPKTIEQYKAQMQEQYEEANEAIAMSMLTKRNAQYGLVPKKLPSGGTEWVPKPSKYGGRRTAGRY